MNNLSSTGNAVFSLNYHFIAVVKYRQPIFTNDQIINDLKGIINNLANTHDITIISQECGCDHVHVLFSCKPATDIPKFINVLKGYTSRQLRAKYSEFFKDKLWGDALWSPSYFLSTAGNTSLDTLTTYINTQRTLNE